MNNRSAFIFQSPSGQLFLLFGLFFVFYLVALLVTTGIAMTGVSLEKITAAEELSDIFQFNLNDAAFVSKLKWAQLFSSVLIFIVPPVVFFRLSASGRYAPFETEDAGGHGRAGETLAGYFQLDKSFPVVFALVVPIIVIGLLPLINVMAEINGKMALPGFLHDVEMWMKKAEEDAKVMTETFLRMDSAGSLIFNVIMIGIIPAFGEELLFRGVVQKLFTRWTKNQHWGIWIAAALFSALHGQFYGFLPRMLLGGLLGYLLLWSGSLWLPVFAHFINNGSAVLVSFMIQKEMLPPEIENIGTGEDEIYFLIASILIVFPLVWMIFKRRVEEPASI